MTGRQRYLMLCKYSDVLVDFRKTYNGLKRYVLRGFSYEQRSLYFFDIINTIAMCLLLYSSDKDRRRAIQRELALLRKISYPVHIPKKRNKKKYKKNPPINTCAYCKKEKRQYLTSSVFGKVCENCRAKLKRSLPVFDFIELFYDFSENDDCIDIHKMYNDFLEYSGKRMTYLSFVYVIRYNYKNIKTIRKGTPQVRFFVGLRRKDDIKNDY